MRNGIYERYNTKDCGCDSQAPSWWNDLQNKVFARLFPPCPEHDEAGTESEEEKIMDAATLDSLAEVLSSAMEASIASNAELADKLRNVGLWLSDGAKFPVRRPNIRGGEATPWTSTGPRNLAEINRVNDAKHGRKTVDRKPIRSLADINATNASIHRRV
jgi:hypothetical protein